MKKKMFFKMGVALLLSLAVIVGLVGCGAKPSAPANMGESTTYNNGSTEKPTEGMTDSNDLPSQDPDDINVDNGHDLTPQIGDPPYFYDVGGVDVECNINIYDYIYNEGAAKYFDLNQMAIDNGYDDSEWALHYKSMIDDSDYAYLQLAFEGSHLAIIAATPAVNSDDDSSSAPRIIRKNTDIDSEYTVVFPNLHKTNFTISNYNVTFGQIVLLAYTFEHLKEDGADFSYADIMIPAYDGNFLP